MAVQRNVIAIVDDDPEIRDALERLLSSRGFRTELYASAEEFIGAAIVTEASCLVVDMQLGDISGVELGRHLSATGYNYPIIFITGSQDETLRRQAMDLGCVAYLYKPFSKDQFFEAITKALEDKFRSYAEACLRVARSVTDEAARARWTAMALQWRQWAQQASRNQSTSNDAKD